MILTLPNEKVFIASTRFNSETYLENMEFKKRVKWDGCVYGAPRELPTQFTKQDKILVIEMNNTTNQIMGIGIIYNIPIHKRFKIYKDKKYSEYNRIHYKGKFRIDRDTFMKPEYDRYHDVIEKLEKICFKGKNHIKRAYGITLIPKQKYVDSITKEDSSKLMKLCNIL